MTYTVTWKRSAAERLAEAWLNTDDRNAVRQSADIIDSLLKERPSSHGESRGEHLRILIVRPLAVLYEIDEDGCSVAVLAVRYIPEQ